MLKNILKIYKRSKTLKNLSKHNKRYFSENSEKFSEIKNNAFNTQFETEQILKIQNELENEKSKNKKYHYNQNFYFIIKNVSLIISIYVLYKILNFLEKKKKKMDF